MTKAGPPVGSRPKAEGSPREDDLGDLRFDEHGLIPTIVQDASTGTVLMLGYSNRASLAATEATGLVHFWSRSRDTLWKKGETSGNTLAVVSIAADCDRDALLVTAHPSGPTCHTGAVACFDPGSGGAMGLQGFAALERLWATIAARAADRPEGSYTVALLHEGVDATGRKLVEEATETLLAAKDHAASKASDARVAEEAADVLYHLFVLLAERAVPAGSVIAELERRAR